MDSGADSGNFHVESENQANPAEGWEELRRLNLESSCAWSLHLDLFFCCCFCLSWLELGPFSLEAGKFLNDKGACEAPDDMALLLFPQPHSSVFWEHPVPLLPGTTCVCSTFSCCVWRSLLFSEHFLPHLVYLVYSFFITVSKCYHRCAWMKSMVIFFVLELYFFL